MCSCIFYEILFDYFFLKILLVDASYLKSYFRQRRFRILFLKFFRLFYFGYVYTFKVKIEVVVVVKPKQDGVKKVSGFAT